MRLCEPYEADQLKPKTVKKTLTSLFKLNTHKPAKLIKSIENQGFETGLKT